ncbi:MAG: transposase, partial [Nitrosopumilus sp.]|nr:transposase [Nitrosopumilus sp.]
MSHSYINKLIHVMWSTKDQKYKFPKENKNELHAHITGIVKSLNGIVLATGGAEDHIHLFCCLQSDISLSNFMKEIKAYSSKWLKTKIMVPV